MWNVGYMGRMQDLPEGKAPIQKGAATYFFAIFPENCMKMKKIGPRGGVRPKFCYVDPPRNILHYLERGL